MTYAVTLCFDGATQTVVSALINQLSQNSDLKKPPNGWYAPHITLGIFLDVVLPSQIEALDSLAQAATGLSVEFAGFGFFASSAGLTLFLSVTPSGKLLQIHRSLHRTFATERRRDSHYDVGKWLPHCTIAYGLDESRSIEALASALSTSAVFRCATISRLELVFAADATRDSIQILHSVEIAGER